MNGKRKEPQQNWKDERLQSAMARSMNGVIRLVSCFVVGCCCLLLYGLFGKQISQVMKEPVLAATTSGSSARNPADWERVENGIHVQTGLAYGKGFDVVRGTCTACHSAKLVTQNRATRQGWKDMITWMQETQGLWDLGTNEGIILDYLATHYAPEEIGRRPGLDMEKIEWYILELEEDVKAEASE